MDNRQGQQERTFEISAQVLPRFFHEHNKCGVVRMQLATSGAHETKLQNNSHLLESAKSTFTFWYSGGSQVRCPNIATSDSSLRISRLSGQAQ